MAVVKGFSAIVNQYCQSVVGSHLRLSVESVRLQPIPRTAQKNLRKGNEYSMALVISQLSRHCCVVLHAPQAAMLGFGLMAVVITVLIKSNQQSGVIMWKMPWCWQNRVSPRNYTHSGQKLHYHATSAQLCRYSTSGEDALC